MAKIKLITGNFVMFGDRYFILATRSVKQACKVLNTTYDYVKDFYEITTIDSKNIPDDLTVWEQLALNNPDKIFLEHSKEYHLFIDNSQFRRDVIDFSKNYPEHEKLVQHKEHISNVLEYAKFAKLDIEQTEKRLYEMFEIDEQKLKVEKESLVTCKNNVIV